MLALRFGIIGCEHFPGVEELALRMGKSDCGGQEQRLADAGAVQALLEAMAQHGGVAAVQQNATAALRNLTAGSEALEQRLAEAGAVEALLQAMAQNRAVQEYAAGGAVEPGRLLRGHGAEARREKSPGGASRLWPCTELGPPCR